MAWPTAADYNDAIQNLRVVVDDDELRAGKVETNPLGLPITYSGNFADVYRVHCPATNNTWAIKCFKREVRGLAERYRDISRSLASVRLPFMVDFQYVEPGIRVNGQRYPYLKMKWIEGFRLNEFVERYLDNRATLKQLLRLWQLLALRMRQADLAHADLQHGNVLLVPVAETGSFSLRLIDYDGLCTPNLKDRPSGELGHPAYQHPQRAREQLYTPDVDRFSHLAIYSAIQCLRTDPELWKKFNNQENLLFRESDFKNPRESEIFRLGHTLRSGTSRALIGKLALAAVRPLSQTPYLEEILVDDGKVFLTQAESDEVAALLGPRYSTTRSSRGQASATGGAAVDEESVQSWLRPVAPSSPAASTQGAANSSPARFADEEFSAGRGAAAAPIAPSATAPPISDPWWMSSSSTVPTSPALASPALASPALAPVAAGGPPMVEASLAPAAPLPAPAWSNPSGPSNPPFAPSPSADHFVPTFGANESDRKTFHTAAVMLWWTGAIGVGVMLFVTFVLTITPGRTEWMRVGPALFMGMVGSLIVLNGGWRMYTRRGYGQALMGAIVASFPAVSPCCFIGIPGVLALILLLSPGGQTAFRD